MRADEPRAAPFDVWPFRDHRSMAEIMKEEPMIVTEIPVQDEEFAIVEIFGHRRHAGRISEAERFGAKLLRIDIPCEGDFAKGYESHYYGGSSIFSLTPTTADVVAKMNAPWRPALPYTREAAERDGMIDEPATARGDDDDDEPELSEDEWKKRFKAALKARMEPGVPSDMAEQCAQQHAEGAWPGNEYEKPEDVASAEADAMAGE